MVQNLIQEELWVNLFCTLLTPGHLVPAAEVDSVVWRCVSVQTREILCNRIVITLSSLAGVFGQNIFNSQFLKDNWYLKHPYRLDFRDLSRIATGIGLNRSRVGVRCFWETISKEDFKHYLCVFMKYRLSKSKIIEVFRI